MLKTLAIPLLLLLAHRNQIPFQRSRPQTEVLLEHRNQTNQTPPPPFLLSRLYNLKQPWRSATRKQLQKTKYRRWRSGIRGLRRRKQAGASDEEYRWWESSNSLTAGPLLQEQSYKTPVKYYKTCGAASQKKQTDQMSQRSANRCNEHYIICKLLRTTDSPPLRANKQTKQIPKRLEGDMACAEEEEKKSRMTHPPTQGKRARPRPGWEREKRHRYLPACRQAYLICCLPACLPALEVEPALPTAFAGCPVASPTCLGLAPPRFLRVGCSDWWWFLFGGNLWIKTID